MDFSLLFSLSHPFILPTIHYSLSFTCYFSFSPTNSFSLSLFRRHDLFKPWPVENSILECCDVSLHPCPHYYRLKSSLTNPHPIRTHNRIWKRSVKKKDMISCGFRSATVSGQSYIIHFHKAHSNISHTVDVWLLFCQSEQWNGILYEGTMKILFIIKRSVGVF